MLQGKLLPLHEVKKDKAAAVIVYVDGLGARGAGDKRENDDQEKTPTSHCGPIVYSRSILRVVRMAGDQAFGTGLRLPSTAGYPKRSQLFRRLPVAYNAL